MVIDRLENIEKYTLLHPLFEQAIDFLKSHDLHSLEIGKTELKGKDLLVNVAQTNPKKMPNQKPIKTILTFKYPCPVRR